MFVYDEVVPVIGVQALSINLISTDLACFLLLLRSLYLGEISLLSGASFKVYSP